MNKLCKGCRMSGNCDMLNMKSHYTEDCPCGPCILKMICTNVCVEYLKLMHTIYNDLRFVDKMREYKRSMLVSQNKNILRE